MSEQRIVKVIDDSKGRKLFVELAQDVNISNDINPSDKKSSPFAPVTTDDNKINNTLTQLIEDTTSSVVDGIKKVSQPAKITLELGVELAAEGGVWFITKGSVSSTIKVSIEYDFTKNKPT